MEDNHLKITFCSDGGVRENVAGYGIVASVDEQIVLSNKQILPDVYIEYTSHQNEAYGVLASLKKMQKLRQYQKRDIGTKGKMSALLLCDSKTEVKSTNKFQRHGTTFKDCYSADYNILGEIGRVWKILQSEQVFVKPKHIMGHPDRFKNQLTHKEKLNVEADLLATSSLSLKKNYVATNCELANVSLKINKLLVTSKQKKTLQRAY
jgi:hypothetical protein